MTNPAVSKSAVSIVPEVLKVIGIVALLLIFLPGANAQNTANSVGEPGAPYLTFPFSQYVLRSDWAMPIVWKYKAFRDINENENVIAPPLPNEDYNAWFAKMKNYRQYLRGHLNDTSAVYLQVKAEKNKSVRLHYKRVLNSFRLQPGNEIIFNGTAKNNRGKTRFSISLIYIRIGQQLSHAIFKTEKIDSVTITDQQTNLHKAFKIPAYDTKTLLVEPVVYFSSDDPVSSEIAVNNLTLSISATPQNKTNFMAERASFYPVKKSVDTQLYDRKEMQWLKSNFISGFAYLWDSDFWDADKQVFTVTKYCDKMKREFNGFQSVLVWYSYPNTGVDQRNTWEYLNAIPGGITGLKAMVAEFHRNGVKVYFPYTPWEIDTRKTDTLSDSEHWGRIIGQIDADGLFFDTFFDGGNFQYALDKYKKGVSIGTEHHPSLQNIQGYNAVTTSWGQTITPFNNNGVSRLKWLIPGHIQWKIDRNERNRQNSMAYSWINGQGVLVWENIFGWMNTWGAKDRQTLRKINTIYQHFYNLYTSDTWKPYLPAPDPAVHLSSWEGKGTRIWNIVTDKEDTVKQVRLPADDSLLYYYDLWTGEKLRVINKHITVPLHRFGCIFGTRSKPSAALLNLLQVQRAETTKSLAGPDEHVRSLLVKTPQQPPSETGLVSPAISGLLTIKAGKYHLTAAHFKREGGCYPDSDAVDNDTYKTKKNVFGKELILHKADVTLPALQIMPKVVTNGEFEQFLKAAMYRPADTTNFLAHWKGTVCPDSIKSRAVIYVSLQDARAYAKWAGMRLPTEWEWQAAGETNGSSFKFNEVWEWNESERYDGHNRFVTLRGGAGNWQLQTSDWYFPGTTNAQKPGGPQPLNSHCKYYILDAGYDRAGTIGFRCIK